VASILEAGGLNMRKPISIRISEETEGLLNALMKHTGGNQTYVLEYAVRELARKLEVKANERENEQVLTEGGRAK
jgi:predicted DNA-binding protein